MGTSGLYENGDFSDNSCEFRRVTGLGGPGILYFWGGNKGASFLAKRRILIMDDEELVLNVACRMLEFLGYETASARNGEQAVEAYRSRMEAGERFDAVILDWQVHNGMDGLKAMEQLRLMDPEVKGILSSGYSETDQGASTAARGFDGIIAKPYVLKTMQETVEKVLKS
jgi:CheY-like chemotaxis protein